MGNSAKIPADIKFHLYTDRDVYSPGLVIDGVVLLHALENFVTESLHIRMIGLERCQWQEGTSHNAIKHTNEEVFLKVDTVLAKFEQSLLPKGVYAWPFELKLPDELPGSYESRDYEGNYIRYELTVFSVEYQFPMSLVEFRKPIVILESFRPQVSPLEGLIRSHASKCCCKDAGEVGIFVRLSKNVCFIGDSVGADISIDNSKSLTDVHSVIVELVENFYMKEGLEVRNFSKVLSRIKTIEGVQKSTRKRFWLLVDMNPSKVRAATAIGNILAHYFTLRFRVQLQGVCLRNEPELTTKVFVMDKSLSTQPSKDGELTIPPNTQIYPLQKIKPQFIGTSSNPYLTAMNSFVWPSHLFE